MRVIEKPSHSWRPPPSRQFHTLPLLSRSFLKLVDNADDHPLCPPNHFRLVGDLIDNHLRHRPHDHHNYHDNHSATHLIYPPSPQLAPQLFFATQKSNPVSSSLKSNAIIIIIWWRNTNTCPTPPAPLHGWSPCFPRNPAQCDHQCDHDHLEKLDLNFFDH